MDNHFNTVTELTQSSLRMVDNWCKTIGPSITLEQTRVILFARKRKTERIVILTYQGVKLNLTKEVKYLGIILDDKLTWKVPVEIQVKKEDYLVV